VTRPAFSRIEILGSVRAWRGERELSLGPPQQRSVLVLLAVAQGQPIPVHEIIETLWETHPPASAVNVVQTYLKRLRQVLEPERATRRPSQVLPTVNGGYALRAAPEAVDLWRFRRLVRLAREARHDADQARTATLLAEALDLWKGPPAGDLPGLGQHRRVQAVCEEHGSVVGWFAELALITGAVAEALPVVEQAAATRPFDEPLHAHLIRLYHAVGRRSDAVRVYQRSRRRLSDEFGFDPGPELSDAFRELLHDHRPRPAG
jgi:DNA-binding SARP family transcriptional activator